MYDVLGSPVGDSHVVVSEVISLEVLVSVVLEPEVVTSEVVTSEVVVFEVVSFGVVVSKVVSLGPEVTVSELGTSNFNVLLLKGIVSLSGNVDCAVGVTFVKLVSSVVDVGEKSSLSRG